MNILFITASRIGDAVLSTGLLDYMAQKYPDAKVTIVCGPLAASLFEGYPLLQEIIPLKKRKYNAHWAGLWRKVVGTHWDIVVDLRNSAVSRGVRAGQRFIFGSHIDKALHKVEQNAAVMKLSEVPPPKLWFTKEQQDKAEEFMFSPLASSRRRPGSSGSEEQDPGLRRDDGMYLDDGLILAVGPTANWAAKTWPAERFIAVVEALTALDGILPQARVAVFAAAGEEEGAYKVLGSVPSARRIDMIAKTDPGTAAAALSQCDFYIGNDSGLMHMAAAVGTPTIGLFGPSYPAIYRPWGAMADYAATPESFDELIDYEGYEPKTAPCLMESLTVEVVLNKINAFYKDSKASAA